MSAIIGQVLPFLSQEHQQQVATAVERAKQVTMADLNTAIGGGAAGAAGAVAAAAGVSSTGRDTWRLIPFPLLQQRPDIARLMQLHAQAQAGQQAANLANLVNTTCASRCRCSSFLASSPATSSSSSSMASHANCSSSHLDDGLSRHLAKCSASLAFRCRFSLSCSTVKAMVERWVAAPLGAKCQVCSSLTFPFFSFLFFFNIWFRKRSVIFT